MTRLTARGPSGAEPQDPLIRRSWWALSAIYLALAVVAVGRLVLEPSVIDLLAAALVAAAGLAGLRYRDGVRGLEAGRRAEAESLARILQGLSRSVSPDAIVEAIVRELADATASDHVVVVRRRPASRVLEATLVSSRPGVRSSTTLLPIGDLDEADVTGERPLRPVVATAVGVGVGPVARSEARGGALAEAGSAAPPGSAVDQRPVATTPRRHASRSRPAGDALIAERIAGRVRDIYGLTHVLTAPLTTDRETIGAIVISRRTSDPWPDSAGRILAGAATEAASALSRAYSMREAESRASTDALTGLPNRRYFDEFCGLLARRRRAGDAVGVLMVDIDRFKALNDTHGHAIGDEVLRAVGRAVAGAVREDDVPARYGGEEFVVLLRNPTPGVAVEVGERVREAVRGLELRRLGVERVTVSVGAAVATVPDQPIADLVANADRALYRAKRQGRDRVVAG